MKYDIKAKPTLYNGIKFRSRLEAKWAAFFELVGWSYEYEASEINGYNPDFLIKCKSDVYNTNVCIVEVKPTVMLTDKVKNSILIKYLKVPAHILILSDMPFGVDESNNCVIGVGSQWLKGEHNNGYAHEELYDLQMKGVDDFGSTYMAFDGMINGNICRDWFIDARDDDYKEIKRYWKGAGNAVQFKVS